MPSCAWNVLTCLGNSHVNITCVHGEKGEALQTVRLFFYKDRDTEDSDARAGENEVGQYMKSGYFNGIYNGGGRGDEDEI